MSAARIRRVDYRHRHYVKIPDNYFESADYTNLSDIWYIKKFTSTNRTLSPYYEKTILSQILFINKYHIIEYIQNGSQIILIMFTPCCSCWYMYDGIIDNNCYNFDSLIYSYTYKGRLYEMRTSELYFGAMPRDILDEVIKFL